MTDAPNPEQAWTVRFHGGVNDGVEEERFGVPGEDPELAVVPQGAEQADFYTRDKGHRNPDGTWTFDYIFRSKA